MQKALKMTKGKKDKAKDQPFKKEAPEAPEVQAPEVPSNLPAGFIFMFAQMLLNVWVPSAKYDGRLTVEDCDWLLIRNRIVQFIRAPFGALRGLSAEEFDDIGVYCFAPQDELRKLYPGKVDESFEFETFKKAFAKLLQWGFFPAMDSPEGHFHHIANQRRDGLFVEFTVDGEKKDGKTIVTIRRMEIPKEESK